MGLTQWQHPDASSFPNQSSVLANHVHSFSGKETHKVMLWYRLVCLNIRRGEELDLSVTGSSVFKQREQAIKVLQTY